jgi:hypothetical protein
VRAWKKVVLASLSAAALLAALFVWKVGHRNVYGIARYGTQRCEGDLKLGQSAPDVSLVSLAARPASGSPIRRAASRWCLSSAVFKGKPGPFGFHPMRSKPG